jgi:type II secretory ATPase GspE/PulE/Tfp pilus assembly ATPase PilB-like protein
MIREAADEAAITERARRNGTEPLMSNALRKLISGVTTTEEILRVIPTVW